MVPTVKLSPLGLQRVVLGNFRNRGWTRSGSHTQCRHLEFSQQVPERRGRRFARSIAGGLSQDCRFREEVAHRAPTSGRRRFDSLQRELSTGAAKTDSWRRSPRQRAHPELANAVQASETGRQAWESLPEKVKRVLERAV